MSRKKVLIVTYYWPPAGGPGVQRCLKFAKYLPKFGWDPIVVTVSNGEYPATDESLLPEANGIKTYYTKTVEPFSMYKRLLGKGNKEEIETFVLQSKSKGKVSKFATAIRNNLFIPDARIGWYYRSKNDILNIARKEKVDLIFSSSPPHSLQLIAKFISEKLELPWVVDFRDPWNGAFWESEVKRLSYFQNLNLAYESSVKKFATEIVTVSKGLKDILANGNKNLSDKINIIYNGYDESDFSSIKKNDSKKLRVTYTGSIAKSQIPYNLIDAVAGLSKEDKNKVEFIFFGKYDVGLVEYIRDKKVEDVFNLNSYIPHSQALEEIAKADLLLLLIPNVKSKGILTGKIFEYIGTGNTIVALGPKGSEVEEMIIENELGQYFSYTENLKDYLVVQFLKSPFNPKIRSTDGSIFTRESQTKRLVEVFNKAVCQ